MQIRPWHAVAAIAVIGAIATLAEIPREDWLTMAAFSLCCGVAALSLMAAAALLGGRLRPIESVYGGLDRVYITHKWLAIAALVLASVHFALARKAIRIRRARRELLRSTGSAAGDTLAHARARRAGVPTAL